MNTQDQYSFIDEIISTCEFNAPDMIYDSICRSCGRKKSDDVHHAKQLLITEIERVKKEARIEEVERINLKSAMSFVGSSRRNVLYPGDLTRYKKERIKQLSKEQNT